MLLCEPTSPNTPDLCSSPETSHERRDNIPSPDSARRASVNDSDQCDSSNASQAMGRKRRKIDSDVDGGASHLSNVAKDTDLTDDCAAPMILIDEQSGGDSKDGLERTDRRESEKKNGNGSETENTSNNEKWSNDDRKSEGGAEDGDEIMATENEAAASGGGTSSISASSSSSAFTPISMSKKGAITFCGKRLCAGRIVCIRACIKSVNGKI